MVGAPGPMMGPNPAHMIRIEALRLAIAALQDEKPEALKFIDFANQFERYISGGKS